jgi:hypothetical protein
MTENFDNVLSNARVLFNATEFCTAIVKQVAGDAVSNSLGGSQLSRDALKSLILARLQKQLSIIPSSALITSDKVDAICQKMILAAMGADENKVTLYPEPGSPLALMGSTSDTLGYNLAYLRGMSDNEVVEGIHSALMADPSSDLANPYAGADFSVTVKQIADNLINHISFMKNVVLPLIDEYASKVNADIEIPMNIMEKFDIRISDLAEPLQDSAFYSSIEENSKGQYVSPSVRMRTPTPGPQELVKFLMTGSKAVDDMIGVWAAKLGEKELANLWEKIFGPASADLMEALSFGNKSDAALFTWLVANRIADEAPDGTAMTLSQLKVAASQYKEVSAIAIRRHVENYNNLEKAGIVVLSYDDKTSVVNVHGRNYAEFIKNGGRNEVLLGAMLEGGSALSRTGTSLMENASKYQAAFDATRALENARYRNSMFERVKRSLAVNFADLLLQAPGEFEQNAWNKMDLNPAKLQSRANALISGITGHDTKDLYDLCIRVITGARFYYTDACVFLTSMNIAAKENKDMDPREAALVATVELVCDYGADQIKTSTI